MWKQVWKQLFCYHDYWVIEHQDRGVVYKIVSSNGNTKNICCELKLEICQKCGHVKGTITK
jgi:hypothetical protein